MKKQKISLQDCYKTFTTDQDKALTPQQTVDNFFKKLENFEIKILSEVKRIDNGRLDIPVYFSVCTDAAQALTGTKKQMGKGASPIQSKASACMELAERFSFFAFKSKEQNFYRGDYQQMRAQGYPVLDTAYLLKSVGDQNLTVEQLEELLNGLPLQWTWATDMKSDKLVLVPFSWFFAINEFNGPSAGNTIEEALMQGISEVVERHVCSIVNQDKIETPQIDLDSVNDPVARELIEKFKRNGIDLYLNDFTLNTGICTVAALAIDRSTFPDLSEIVYTAGTTPDPDKSVIRAITEVAQLAGDFNSGSNYVASGLPKPLTMDEVSYITDTKKKVSVEQLPNLSDKNIKVEIENCLGALSEIDLDVFVIDVTHPELQIAALYTIIPGAHFRERSVRKDAGLFAAKLLYELTEDEIFFNQKLSDMEAILPDRYYLSFYRGIERFNSGDFLEAIKNFNKALKLDPEEEDLPYIYSYKGHALKDLGQYDDAIVELKNGCALDDERPDLHNLLGFCFFKKGEYETAISSFERAVQLNPSSAMDYANLGVNHNRLGNRDEAVRYFTLALTLDPTLDFVHEQLKALSDGE